MSRRTVRRPRRDLADVINLFARRMDTNQRKRHLVGALGRASRWRVRSTFQHTVALALLEILLQHVKDLLEDRLDAEEAWKALIDATRKREKAIPWERVKKDLGL